MEENKKDEPKKLKDAPVGPADAGIQAAGGCLEVFVGRIPLILISLYLAYQCLFN